MNSKKPDCYQDIIELATSKNVEFVDLKFIDLPGSWQHLTLTDSRLNPQLFKDGVGFDGSSIRGFQSIEHSDMVLLPDASTAFVDPTCQIPTLSIICDVNDPYSGKGYARDPRFVAKKAEAYMASSGICDYSYWGPELEFFVFDNVRFATHNHESYYHINASEGIWNSGSGKPDNPGHQIRHKEGYFAIQPRDQTYDIRLKMVKAMMQAGQDIFFHHHEVATAGQSEIGMRYGTLIEQADNILINKYIVRNIASQNGYTATFMPKPVFGDNGNAMHVHLSLWKEGVNLFYDRAGYAQLSRLAQYCIGGILAHTPALLALCAPSTNSYRRLVPGFEAPVNLVYSQCNRSAAVRIPAFSPDAASKRIEYRCPDATCNPYLAFAAIMMAGMDGIRRRIDPGQPSDQDVFALQPEEKAALKTVPDSLAESLNALEKDHAFLLEGGVFSADLIEAWIDYKNRNEVKAISLRPHPYEFQLYYDA